MLKIYRRFRINMECKRVLYSSVDLPCPNFGAPLNIATISEKDFLIEKIHAFESGIFLKLNFSRWRKWRCRH